MQRAAEILGGKDAVCAFLGVPRRRLELWMTGQVSLPGDVFLRIVDVLLEQSQEASRQPDLERPRG